MKQVFVVIFVLSLQGCQEGCHEKKEDSKEKIVVQRKVDGSSQSALAPESDDREDFVSAVQFATPGSKLKKFRALMKKYIDDAKKTPLEASTVPNLTRALTAGTSIDTSGSIGLVFNGEYLNSDPSFDGWRMLGLRNAGFVIKYGLSNALSRDYMFMAALAKIGETGFAKSNSLSQPSSPVPLHTSVKGLPAKFGGSSVRFAVMPEIGVPLRDFLLLQPTKVLPFNEAVTILCSLVDHLRILHEHGVVHANLHWGNVFVKQGAASMEVTISDFSNSCVYDECTPIPIRENPEVCSPSELRPDHVPTFADDLYRAYEMVGAMMTGPEFYHAMLKEGRESSYMQSAVELTPPLKLNKLKSIKENSNWFAEADTNGAMADTIPNSVARTFHRNIHLALKDTKSFPVHGELSNLLRTLIDE